MFSICLFFFFKQKTAYELRISDWSSDVCSSDLADDGLLTRMGKLRREAIAERYGALVEAMYEGRSQVSLEPGPDHAPGAADAARSEEHTSELQSLMRISYAVFCLKKKNHFGRQITYANTTRHTPHTQLV